MKKDAPAWAYAGSGDAADDAADGGADEAAGVATAASTWVRVWSGEAGSSKAGGTVAPRSERKSRTWVIVQRRAGSRTMVASSSGVIQPASPRRGGSSFTMR